MSSAASGVVPGCSGAKTVKLRASSFVPGVSQVWQHFPGEEVDVLQSQFVRHRADLQEDHEVAHAQALDDLFPEPVANGGRAARDDVSLLHEVPIAQALGILGAAHRIGHGCDEASVVLVSRRGEPDSGYVETLVVEVLDVLCVLFLSARVRLGDGHQLQEPGAVRVRVSPLLGDDLPVSLHHRSGRAGARVAEEAVADVVLDGEIEGADAPRARHPHGRMGLLDGARPQIHVGQLVVAAVPREDLAGLPRL